MTEPLRLLLIEDSEEDAFFVLRYLKRADQSGRGISSERVETLDELAAALENGASSWDAVVSDWSLPGFDGLDALGLVREKDPDMPFIIVSATIGEERAVEAMKAGAHDYVPKSNLARLRTAIEREIEAAQERRERRRAEERYRSIFENAVDGIFQTTPEGRPVAANPAMARILGYDSPKEALESIHDIAGQLYVDPARRVEFGRVMREKGTVTGFEVELYRKDGSTVWISLAARTVRDSDGEAVGYEGIVEDITERKRAEEALKESEELHRAVVEQSAESIFLVEADTRRILRPNAALRRFLGYSAEELQRMTLYDVVAHDRESIDRNSRRILTEGRYFVGERRYRRKDGALVDVEVSASTVPCGGKRAMCVVSHDITERKKAEEALKEREEQYRAAFQQAAVGMAHASPSGRFLRVNDSFCEILGYRREELLEMGSEQVTHPEDLDEDLRHAERVLADKKLRTYSVEKRYVRKDGARVWVDLAVSLVRDTEDQPKYFISIVQDVTQRKLAELVPEPLNPQETEVLKLLVRGRTNREIADELAYSFGTIKLHVRGILAKLGVESRKRAARLAVDIGLVSHPEPASRKARGSHGARSAVRAPGSS